MPILELSIQKEFLPSSLTTIPVELYTIPWHSVSNRMKQDRSFEFSIFWLKLSSEGRCILLQLPESSSYARYTCFELPLLTKVCGYLQGQSQRSSLLSIIFYCIQLVPENCITKQTWSQSYLGKTEEIEIPKNFRHISNNFF